MIDICNIFAGGLKRNLIDWEIQDNEGKMLENYQWIMLLQKLKMILII